MSVQEPTLIHGMTAFKRDLMLLLASTGPTSGTELRERLEAYAGRSCSNGALYPALEGFAEDGLVEANPDTGTYHTEYALTAKGWSEVEAYRSWVESMTGFDSR